MTKGPSLAKERRAVTRREYSVVSRTAGASPFLNQPTGAASGERRWYGGGRGRLRRLVTG